MQRHTFAKLVNELRDLPQIQSKRELIVKTLKAYGVEPEEPLGKNLPVLELLTKSLTGANPWYEAKGFTLFKTEDYGMLKDLIYKHEETGTFYLAQFGWLEESVYKFQQAYQVQARSSISYSFKEFPDGI